MKCNQQIVKSYLKARYIISIILFVFFVSECGIGPKYVRNDDIIVSDTKSDTKTKTIKPDDPKIKYFGRFDKTDKNAPAFTWPGVYIKFKCKTSSLKVLMNDKNNKYNLLIDGVYNQEFITKENIREFDLLKDFDTTNPHEFTIYKKSEYFNNAVFLGLKIDKDAELLDITEKPHRIEFLGDSYTVGYGNLAAGTTGYSIWKTTDNYQSYARLTADFFDADFMINAWSGIGLVKNHGGTAPNPDSYLAKYKMTVQSSPNPEWTDWSFSPNLVVIFLGLNDLSTQEKYEVTEKEYDKAYTELINQIYKHYPNVKILCLGYPWVNIDTYVKALVDSQTASGNTNIAYALCPGTGDNLGADWHPNLKGHINIFEALKVAIKDFMGW